MHAVKKKLCLRALGGIQELQACARQTVVRRFLSKSCAAGFVRESTRTAHVAEGRGISYGNLNHEGASSCFRGLNSGVRSRKHESLLRVEGLQIGGLRHMGITTRPTDRAAEHGMRNPLPFADGSPERIEEQRQDEFLRDSKRAAASNIQQVEEAVGGQGGASFEPTDTETSDKLGRNSADLIHETASEFVSRSESHSTGAQSGTEVHDDGNFSDGIDEEVARGLIADSEFPVGRVAAKDDRRSSSPGDEEGLVTGALSDEDLGHKESGKDGRDRCTAL